MIDNVNHPRHYQSDTEMECWEAIRAALGAEGYKSFCMGNIIKYLWRDKVNELGESVELQDAKKAQWYLNSMIKEMER